MHSVLSLPSRSPRRAAAVFTVTAAALTLAGCGAGEKDSAQPTPTAPPEVLQSELPSESPTMAPATEGAQDSDITAGTATDACITANLDVTLGGQDGAAGTVYYHIVFTNTGADCQMIGFPGVSIVGDGNGRQIGAPAARDSVGTDYVTLGRGEFAVSTVGVSQAGAYDPASCNPLTSDGFRIYPPGNTNSVFVQVPGITGCDNPDLSILHVGPVTPA